MQWNCIILFIFNLQKLIQKIKISINMIQLPTMWEQGLVLAGFGLIA